MVRAQTTKEQNEIAKEKGLALFAYACKSGGTVSMDGPISHDLAQGLNRLMAMVLTDRICPTQLRNFLEELK